MTSIAGWRPIFYLIVLGSSWGLYFALLKIAVLSGISYVGILTLTTLGVCAGMVIIALLRNRLPVMNRRHLTFYLICALLGYLLPMIAEMFIIKHMPVSVLTLIVSVSPLATLFFAWLMKTDRITPRRVCGMVLGSSAIFAILLPEAHLNQEVAWHWLLLATLVPFSYALYHNYIARYWPPGSDSYQVACGEAIVGSILLIVFSVFNWQWADVQSWNDGHSAIAVMSLIALVDIYIYFELIRLRGPIFTSHANYFMVVSGVLWGMVIFAEQPGPLVWVSAALLIASLYLVTETAATREKACVQND